LARHFLGRFGAAAEKGTLELSASAAEKVLAYRWPGNVRELENCMERAVALAHFDEITIEDLPDKVRDYVEGPQYDATDEETEGSPTLAAVERRHVLRVLQETGG